MLQSNRDADSSTARSVDNVSSPRQATKLPLPQATKEKSKVKRSPHGQDKVMERSDAVDDDVMTVADDAKTMSDRIEQKWREVRMF